MNGHKERNNSNDGDGDESRSISEDKSKASVLELAIIYPSERAGESKKAK